MAIAQIMPEPRQAGVVRRAVRIFEIFEIGRMGAGGMIAVDAVFGEQFPVATDRIFLRSADDRHALGRLFRNKLEIITGAREIGRQVFAVGGKADEEKIAEAIETRCMGELLAWVVRSEEHTSELQSLMRISYAVFCLNKKINTKVTDMNKLI